MKCNETYEEIITRSNPGGYYVPFGRTAFHSDTSNNSEDNGLVCIWEILDDNLTVKAWFFKDRLFAEKNKKNQILVGELFLDFYNESIDFCNINHDRNLSPSDRQRIEKLRESLDSVYGILSSGTNKEKNSLLRAFSFEKELRCESAEIKMYSIGDAEPFGREYLVPTKYGGLESSFFIEDLSALIKDTSIKIEKCAYCGKLYIHRKVNQKYCPECVQNKISAQLKKRNKSNHCILRQKIYGRLYVRDGAGNNWNYGYGIHDSNSFSEIANTYKENHTQKQYYEWLKEIEQLTLSKNKK